MCRAPMIPIARTGRLPSFYGVAITANRQCQPSQRRLMCVSMSTRILGTVPSAVLLAYMMSWGLRTKRLCRR